MRSSKILAVAVALVFSLILTVSTNLTAAPKATTPQIQRMDPPFWYAGMKNHELQVMYYGEDIAASEFSLADYPGVSVKEVAKVNRENGGAHHGGDLQGIKDHLEYIDDLGVTAISDFYLIDPRLGSNEEYCDMIEAAHARGIKVVMDMGRFSEVTVGFTKGKDAVTGEVIDITKSVRMPERGVHVLDLMR